MEVGAEELRTAVERQQGGKARLLESVAVSEEFEGRPVWQGIVHVFELEGHPTATRAYAWSSSRAATSASSTPCYTSRPSRRQVMR
jgi:hypothetical protein